MSGRDLHTCRNLMHQRSCRGFNGKRLILAIIFIMSFVRLGANKPVLARTGVATWLDAPALLPEDGRLMEIISPWLDHFATTCTLDIGKHQIDTEQLLSSDSTFIEKDSGVITLEDVEIRIWNPCVITDRFTRDNELMRTDTLRTQSVLVMNPWEDAPMFELISVQSHNPGFKSTIQYRLVPSIMNWTPLVGRRTLRFSQLPVGEHTMEVRTMTMDGESGPVFSYPIKLRSYWYHTTGGRLIIIFIILGLTATGYTMIRTHQKRTKTRRENAPTNTKSSIYTAIAHELRTPLDMISSITGQVMENPEEWLDDGIKTIKTKSEELLHIVSQMNDVSGLENGTYKLEPVQSDMIHFLNKIVDQFQLYARTKDIRIHILPAVPNLFMDFDPKKMQLVVSNLLSNAIRYTPNGGDIYISSEQVKKKKEEHCLISITDTGIGLSKNQLNVVNQLNDHGIQYRHKPALGLSLTRDLIQLMNGTLTVDSTPGKGATFAVAIPISRKAPVKNLSQYLQSLTPPSKTTLFDRGIDNQVSSATSESPLLLLIEPSPEFVEDFTDELREKYRIVTAQNALDGFNKAVKLIPDLILISTENKRSKADCIFPFRSESRTSHIPVLIMCQDQDQPEFDRTDSVIFAPRNMGLHSLSTYIDHMIKSEDSHRFTDPSQTRDDGKKSAKEDAFLGKVKSIVEKNINNEDFGITQLCQEMHVSRTQLHRKLKAITNSSTSRVIRSIRLQKARELLESSDQNVSEVGYAVGFTNRSHFTQVFTEEFGQPPSSYKRM